MSTDTLIFSGIKHATIFILSYALILSIFISCDIFTDEYDDECTSYPETWTLSMPDTGYAIDTMPFNNVPEFLNNSWEYTSVYISSNFHDSHCSESILRFTLSRFDSGYIDYSIINITRDTSYEYRHQRTDSTNFEGNYALHLSPLSEETDSKVLNSNGDEISLKAGPAGCTILSKKYGVLYRRIGKKYSQYGGTRQIYKLSKYNNEHVNTDSIVNTIISKLDTIHLMNEDMVYIPAASFSPGKEGGYESFPVGNRPIAFEGFFASVYETTNRQAMEVYNYGIRNGKLIVQDGDLYLRDGGTLLLAVENPEWGLQHGLAVSGDTLKVKNDHNEHPITCITWYGAVVYCNLLSEKSKLLPCYDLTTWECIDGSNGYRLPYELEWEYIAGNGGRRTVFPWSTLSADSSKAHYNTQLEDTDTRPVGSFPEGDSDLNIFDLSGNVWEWVNDWYFHFPEGTGLTNLKGPSSGTEKVRRGGSYFDTEIYLKAASRSHAAPEVTAGNIGFRVVRNTFEYR